MLKNMANLRRIKGVTRRHNIKNEEICNRPNIRCGIIDRIQNKRLRYFGHLIRMQDGGYLKIAYNGYVHGAKKRGRPKKRWLYMIKED